MHTDNDEAPRVAPTGKRGGQWVHIGDAQYRVPPLGLLQIQDLEADVEVLKSMDTKGGLPSHAQMKAACNIVHAAISRNYPDMKATDVEGMLDLGNFWDVIKACLTISGFKPGKESAGSGETAASTGTASTPL